MRVREVERAFIRNEYKDMSEPSAIASLVREYKLMKDMLRAPKVKEGFWKR